MQRVLSWQLPDRVGRPVRIAGWVHRRRLLKSVAFLIVRDATGLSQVVVTDPAVRAAVERLTEETVVEVDGTVVANQPAPAGVELVDPRVRVLGELAVPPPFDLYRPSLTAALSTQLDHAPLSLRHPRRSAALRVSAAAAAGFRATLEGAGFVEVHTPKVVESATESGANAFTLDWFGRPAYLAQSPQFYKQLMVGVFERVYEVGPVFRAEPHDTARHLAQYTSLDAELGFITDHREVMMVVRDVLAGMLSSVAERATAALTTLGVTPPPARGVSAEVPGVPVEVSGVPVEVSGVPVEVSGVPVKVSGVPVKVSGVPVEVSGVPVEVSGVPAEIPAVHFTEALAIAGAPADELDLAPAHERALGEWAARAHGSQFVFVTGYPMAKRPFYTHPDPDRPAYSNGFDLLFRGVELVTGGQRLHRYGDYLAALRAAGEPVEPYRSYVEAFRHGIPPHGGFAIGLERFVAQLTGVANVRQATAFPRDLHRLTP